MIRLGKRVVIMDSPEMKRRLGLLAPGCYSSGEDLVYIHQKAVDKADIEHIMIHEFIHRQFHKITGQRTPKQIINEVCRTKEFAAFFLWCKLHKNPYLDMGPHVILHEIIAYSLTNDYYSFGEEPLKHVAPKVFEVLNKYYDMSKALEGVAYDLGEVHRASEAEGFYRIDFNKVKQKFAVLKENFNLYVKNA